MSTARATTAASGCGDPDGKPNGNAVKETVDVQTPGAEHSASWALFSPGALMAVHHECSILYHVSQETRRHHCSRRSDTKAKFHRGDGLQGQIKKATPITALPLKPRIK
jgi:hypothetical protein